MTRSRRSRTGRDTRSIASGFQLAVRPLALPPSPWGRGGRGGWGSVRQDMTLSELSDRRRWHPQPNHMRHHGLRVDRSGKRSLSPFVGFQAPERVLVCVRRKRRREVMFAKGGAGRRRMRRPRRNYWSDVRC